MKKVFLNILLLCLFITSLSGCKPKNDTVTPKDVVQVSLSEEQEKNAEIKTDFVKMRDLDLQITIPAQFKAMYQALDRIYTPVEGKVTKVYVEYGEIIKKGQPLIEIKSDSIGQIQLELLDKIIVTDADIKQAQAQYQLSVQNFKREDMLFKDKITSRADYEAAKAQLTKDKAYYDSLNVQKNTLINVFQQRLSLYGADGGAVRRVISSRQIYPYITLRANKNGIVLDRKVNPGELVDANKELFNIADLSKIWLVGYAFEKDALYLKNGENVSAYLEEPKTGSMAQSNATQIKGKLSYVSSILDPDAKTLEVRADIDNKEFLIKPNMYAQMFVDIGKSSRLTVPNGALEHYGDCTLAFVKVKDHLYEQRKVVVGNKNEHYSEVISGLKDGEEVVYSGAFSVLGEILKQNEKD